MLRKRLLLFVDHIAAFVLSDFLVVQVVVSIYESFMMYWLSQFSRVTWYGNAFHEWLLLADSIRLHAHPITKGDHLGNACKDVPSSTATYWTW